MVPLRRWSGRRCPGGRRRSCRRTRRPRRRTRRPARAGRSPAGRRSAPPAGSAPDERRRDRARPRRARGPASRRSCSCRACRRRRRACARRRRRRRPAATARPGCRRARAAAELRVVGVDRGQGLGHRQAVGRRLRPSTCAAVVRRAIGDPERLERPACTATAARIAAGHDRAGACGAGAPPRSRPAPAAPTTWIRSPGRIGSGGATGRESRPDRGRRGVTAVAVVGASRPRPARAASSRARRRAAPLVLRSVAGPDEPPDRRRRPRRRPRRRSARPASPSLPPSGPAMPVTDDREVAPESARGRRSAIAIADLRRHRAVAPRGRRPGTPTQRRLRASFGVGHEAADEVGARARDLGDQVADQARRCTTRRVATRAARAPRQIASPSAVARAAPIERIVRHRLPPLRLVRAVGRREQPRLGHAGLAERAERRAVEREVASRPTSRSGPRSSRCAGERQRLAARDDRARRADAGSSLPSTQTLIQARPPLIVTTRFTPLYATVTLRVRRRRSCPRRSTR